MSEKPLKLWCRKTKQPVTMREGETCPHCGASMHGLDLSDLNAEIGLLSKPPPKGLDK